MPVGFSSTVSSTVFVWMSVLSMFAYVWTVSRHTCNTHQGGPFKEVFFSNFKVLLVEKNVFMILEIQVVIDIAQGKVSQLCTYIRSASPQQIQR